MSEKDKRQSADEIFADGMERYAAQTGKDPDVAVLHPDFLKELTILKIIGSGFEMKIGEAASRYCETRLIISETLEDGEPGFYADPFKNTAAESNEYNS